MVTVVSVVSGGMIPPKSSIDNDFAIIKLATPVTFSDRVKPICLPSILTNYDTKVVTVTGWGTTSSGGSQPAVLQKVNVTESNLRESAV